MKGSVVVGLCIFVLFSKGSAVCCADLPVELHSQDERYVVVNAGRVGG
jgi:hypothetical protein